MRVGREGSGARVATKRTKVTKDEKTLTRRRSQISFDSFLCALWSLDPNSIQITGLMPQILSAYSRMLRSLEKGPMLSALATALRDHSS
jgi:hypothetical protein